MRTNVEARVGVLAALLEGALGDGAEVANGQQLHPRGERVAKDVADPAEEAKDGQEELNGLIVGNGPANVLALFDEAKRLGKGHLPRDVVRGIREEVAELHRLVVRGRMIEPSKEAPEHLVYLRFRAQDIVLKKPWR